MNLLSLSDDTCWVKNVDPRGKKVEVTLNSMFIYIYTKKYIYIFFRLFILRIKANAFCNYFKSMSHFFGYKGYFGNIS